MLTSHMPGLASRKSPHPCVVDGRMLTLSFLYAAIRMPPFTVGKIQVFVGLFGQSRMGCFAFFLSTSIFSGGEG